MAAIEDRSHVMVAAIDFGTTFSGYAFSFVSTPENIVMNKNWGENVGFATRSFGRCIWSFSGLFGEWILSFLRGPKECGLLYLYCPCKFLLSFKTHSSVLLTTKGEFVDYGFDAEDKYAGMEEEEEQEEGAEEKYNLFRHFKMILHTTAKMSRSTMIAATNGNKAPAIEIFAHALKYLKQHLIKAVTVATGGEPDEDMIRWVITVPAIWTEESKQFMREAARKAGCIAQKDSRKLVIALEPEAASLCCRRLDIAKYPDKTDLSIQSGTKYLVIDSGGGTVDITAHQILADGSIRELHSATGGAWGGTKVDENFVGLLRRVLGDRFIDGFQKKFPQQWLVFMTNFEKLKKSVSLREKKNLNIPLSYAMAEEYPAITGGGSIEKAIKNKKGLGVSFAAGTMVINHTTAKGFFEPVVKTIIQHVNDLLSRPEIQPCHLFFLVGGFSESVILQDMVKEAYTRKGIEILIPGEAQMAVIKGAVLFGHKPKEIKSRVARLTYGCKVLQSIQSLDQVDRQRIVVLESGVFLNNVFKTFVGKGEEIEEGDKRCHSFSVIQADQKKADILLFSMDRKPKDIDFVDDDGVKSLGHFEVEAPGYGLHRPVEIAMTFGGTEIQVEGKASGKPASTTIDFMTD